MTETPEEKAAREAAEAAALAAKQGESKPPWGSPEEFDPEKAWALIVKLREQKNDPAAAKELKELRDKVEAFENEKRTDVEKANARAERAEKALQEREAKDAAATLASEIAKERELDAGVLRGSTREELEAHADQLAAAFKVAKPTAPPADSQGENGGPVSDGKELSAADTVAAALKR